MQFPSAYQQATAGSQTSNACLLNGESEKQAIAIANYLYLRPFKQHFCFINIVVQAMFCFFSFFHHLSHEKFFL